MQLILTDTDIGIHKMTTIKQDSVEEKFTNSLIEKVCSDVTTTSNDCIKNQELIVHVYDSIKTDEHITHNTNSENVADESDNGNYKHCDEECDKQQKKNVEKNKVVNEQTEIYEENNAREGEKGMQYDEKSDFRSKPVSLDKGDAIVHANEIEISATIKQQDTLQKEIGDKGHEPSKEEQTKMEEKVGENIKIYTETEDGIEELNRKDLEIEMEVGEVQAELKDKIEELTKVAATAIEDETKEQNELNTKTEDKIAELNEVNTDVEDNILEKNQVDIEIQELNHDKIAIKMDKIFEEKHKEDIETVKKIEEYIKETINVSDVDLFRDSYKLQDRAQESDSSNTEDKTKKQDNVEIDISVQDKQSNVKDCTREELDTNKDEIHDKAEDIVKIKDGTCKDNIELEEDHNISKSKEEDGMSSDIKEKLDIKEQKLLNGSANYETNVTTEQLDQIATNTDCDLNKMTCDSDLTIAPQKTEVHTEMKNNNINDEKMDVDLEQNSGLRNSDTEGGDKILSNNNSKVTELEIDVVIDIADEKDEDYECVMDQDMDVIENKLENTINVQESVTTDKNFANVLESDIKKNETTDKISELNSIAHTKFVKEDKEHDLKSLHKAIDKSPEIEKNIKEKKKLTHISKLSNTLDILSDEDEDSSNEDSQKDINDTAEKLCIHIEDDDDIMLIDEESNSKDSVNKVENFAEPTDDLTNEECNVHLKDNENEHSFNISKNENEAEGKQSVNETFTSKLEDDKGAEEGKQAQQKPLLPVNFLKTCKKNLADMTRDELEEFCILKIVESVVDRSNLSEIKSQLKSLVQNIEEYRRKASTLTKQNRDLQVVLKSVQEEQKKKSNLPITPLKITRSVGMQVLMTDKTSGMRKKTLHVPNTSQNNMITNSAPNRSGKGQGNQNSKYQKIQTSVSPIPVPRLVPAPNTSHLNNMKVQPPNVNTQGKSNSATSVQVPPVPNGIALSPTPKPEKRSHCQMQQNNSVTVDLTDDEPPAKVIQRNIAPPVRLVPPQNLLAAHRQPFVTNINSPRKVYIPISGSQNHTVGVRPGQTIMLKTISPQGPRQRCPTPVGKNNQSVNSVRMQRLPNRHPAPLPDSMKQYQPPNWKALPPAPELNLSKVDNGIVISWKIEEYHEDEYEEIASYQLYAYQETSSPPSTALWKKIGDVKALPLPMACTLTQFMPGYKYYFAVRAVDVRSRLGPFSLPGSILLLNKI